MILDGYLSLSPEYLASAMTNYRELMGSIDQEQGSRVYEIHQ